MSMNYEREPGGFAWVMLLVGVAAVNYAISLFVGAVAWWEFVTVVIVGLFGLTLFVVNLRGIIAALRRRRAERAQVEAEDSQQSELT